MLPDDLNILVGQLEGLVGEISKEEGDEDVTEKRIEKLQSVLSAISNCHYQHPDHKHLLSQIDGQAVSLWNVSVAKKTSGKVSAQLNAKLRDISCNLAFIASTGKEDEYIYRKKLMMSLKTARAYIDSGNYAKADDHLSRVGECLGNLKLLLTASGRTNPGGSEESLTLEKDRFKLLCYKAESAVGQNLHNEALEQIMPAKELLHVFPQETCYLSMLCYNFGVEAYQRHSYEQAVAWLRDSYELGKTNHAVGSKNQARSLRLLANAYLEWDSKQYWEKAFNAIGLANAEHAHTAGLYMKLKILLQGNSSDDRIKTVLEDIISHGELTMELGLNAVKLIMQFSRPDLALDGLEQLSLKYKNTSEHSQLSVAKLLLLLQDKRMDQAKQHAEDCITGHNTGTALDITTIRQLHMIMWEQASLAVEVKDHSSAVQWYNYSLSLFSPKDHQEDANLSKLHRNRALCLIALNQLDKAKPAADLAEKHDPTAAHTQYILYKIALLSGDEDHAVAALKKMTELVKKQEAEDNQSKSMQSSDSQSTVSVLGDNSQSAFAPESTGLVCLAAQLAFEKNKHSLAVVALENLANTSADAQQVLVVLRCLVRIRLSDIKSQDATLKRQEVGSVMSYLRKAYDQLCAIRNDTTRADINIQNEATWFMKIAWNLALQCEDLCADMNELFTLCQKLSCLCGRDMASLMRQKTCTLMAAAACLQVARSTHQPMEKKRALEGALTHINECKTICNHINEAKTPDAEARMKDSAPVLLLLYEFEARLNLGEANVETILERALLLPNTDAKTFETLAALSMEGRVQNRGVSLRALKVALKKHLHAQDVDCVKCSKVLHSLVQLSVSSGSSGDPTSKEETWGFYMEVVDLLENKSKGSYPEMEVLWLMTKSWNCGIHLYMAGHYLDAERWCGLSMRLLNHLSTLRQNYQTQMTTVYGEILGKIDSSKMEVGKYGH